MDNRARAAMIRKVERRIRAKYRKRGLILFLVALFLGLLLGVLACKQGIIPVKSSSSARPSATVTAQPEYDGALSEVESTPTPMLATPTPTPENAPLAATEAPEQGGVLSNEALSSLLGGITSVDQGNSNDQTQPVTTAQVLPTPTPAATLLTPDGGQDTSVQAVAVEPTAAVVQTDPNAKGSKSNPVRAGEAFEFETQVLSDGMKRTNTSSSEYETLRFSITLKNFLMPDYFQANYANRYKLTGTEAGAELEMTLLSSTGTNSILPQNAVLITFENEAGEINEGYQLMDAAISGTYDIPLAPGETKTLYKRFKYSEEEAMKYMVLTYYIDGAAYKAYFLLEVVEPVVTYNTLVKGDRNDEVKALQERLVELGYLSDTADGIFGSNTESAIRAAQANGGLAQTGVADNEFQQFIFSDSAPSASGT